MKLSLRLKKQKKKNKPDASNKFDLFDAFLSFFPKMEKLIFSVDDHKKIFFASDFHLGTPDHHSSKEREKAIVAWLDSIANEAAAIFLLGDVFDFWFEYRHVVPKGHVRLLGKLASLTDQGIPIYIFSGNHDMWMFGYLHDEAGIKIHHKPATIEAFGFKLYVGHGDGLGPGDRSFKFLKKIFRNRMAQWFFARVHPNLSFGIAKAWSSRSRISNKSFDEHFMGEEEWLYQYCRQIEENEHFDFYIFGHRHLPINMKIGEKSTYINLGEWINHRKYAVLDSKGLELLQFG